MGTSALVPRVSFSRKAIERVKKKLEERAEELKAKDHTVSVGIHESEGSQPKLDYHGKAGSATLAEVAAVHEFGGGNVPARSWLRTWFDQNRSRLAKEMVAVARAERSGDANAIHAQAAAWAHELREWIEFQDGNLAPLSPVTVAAKQRAGLENPTVPLVATHQLVSAIKSMLDGEEVQ